MSDVAKGDPPPPPDFQQSLCLFLSFDTSREAPIDLMEKGAKFHLPANRSSVLPYSCCLLLKQD